MSKELFWLTLTAAMTGLLWVPYILDRIMVRGRWARWPIRRRRDKPQSPWAQRLMFAHTNAVENLVVFAPLVLIAQTRSTSTPRRPHSPARSISGARLAHVVVYTAGIPVARTLAFAGGFDRADDPGAGDLRADLAVAGRAVYGNSATCSSPIVSG